MAAAEVSSGVDYSKWKNLAESDGDGDREEEASSVGTPEMGIAMMQFFLSMRYFFQCALACTVRQHRVTAE